MNVNEKFFLTKKIKSKLKKDKGTARQRARRKGNSFFMADGQELALLLVKVRLYRKAW